MTWLEFTDQNGNFDNYNITLRNTDYTWNATIGNTTELYIPINYSNYTEGAYIMMVEGCDTDELCSNSTSKFTIDKGVYNASISQPANQTTDPNVNATYELKITNTGNFTGNFTLAVVQIDSVDVAALNKTTISNLAVDASQNVTLNVTDADAGKYNVTVNVTSTGSGSEVANTSYIMTTVRGPTLELGNVTNITADWGRDFNLNHSVTVTHTNASNVNVTYNVSWIETQPLGTVNKSEKKWANQTVSNFTVQNITVRVNANSTNASAVNDTETFWINITRRDVTAEMLSSETQSVNVSENFSVNASAVDDYDEDFRGDADLLEDGTEVVSTLTGITKYANFTTNVSTPGTYNFSVLFYNTSYYNNATSDNTTVTVSGAVLEIGNVSDITKDWGRSFWVNHSVKAKNATANNVTLNYSYWLTNKTWASIAEDGTKWWNQSYVNNTVANNSIEVWANATDVNNATDTFWLNITRRDVTTTRISPETQTVNVSEDFNVNASAVDEYEEDFIGDADLLRDGTEVVDTKTGITKYANFTTNVSTSGTYNFSVLFYNTSYYYNATSGNTTVTVSGSMLEIGNVSDITKDWGRSFYVNHSVTARNATANNVTLNYSYWLQNASWASITEDSTDWKNQSVSNNTVANNSIEVWANATDANNASATFWINITKRDIGIVANPEAAQTVDPDETFWINASAKDEYDDELIGKADLLREGIIVATQDIANGNANFSRSEPLAGSSNFSIRFYNLTHYNNATTLNASVTVAAAPNITSFAPPSLVNDTVCTWRTFNVTVNQTVNVSWYLNESFLHTNESTKEANCTLHAEFVGDNNVSAVATNANGTDMQTWVWNVTEAPAPPNITSFAPPSPVNDTVCTWTKFNVTVNQTVNVSWYLNESFLHTNVSAKEANCTLHAQFVGENNVSAVATNANGTDMQTWIWNVTAAPAPAPPNITSFAPPSPVNDTVCTWTKFNVTVNQTVNVSWYLNGLFQHTNESVTEANYTLHAEFVGDNNVSAVASNANGTDMQTWVWNVSLLDNDGDGVPSYVEDGAPNGGDGNGDGTPDRGQSNVTSLPTATNRGYMTLVLSNCTQLKNVTALPESPADLDYNYLYGLVSFNISCENATVEIIYHGTADLAGYTYRKYGPTTPGDERTTKWYTFTNATINGKRITLTLADNQLGDDTGDDGRIVDPGGPGRPGIPPVPVPEYNFFGLLALISLMSVVLATVMRKK